MAEKVYAYIRVSTLEQNDDRQRDAMLRRGIDPACIYTDRQSGKDFCRPQYRRLMRRLRPGDLLCIHSIDRLGRNYREILRQWQRLTREMHVDICVLDMPLLDTRQRRDLLGDLIGDLVLQILSFVAQNEREMIRRRQAEGILAARQRGVRFGRPRKSLPAEFEDLLARWQRGGMTAGEFARRCGVSRSTLYRHLSARGAVRQAQKKGGGRAPSPSDRNGN